MTRKSAASRLSPRLRVFVEDHQALLLWRERNRHALREFWARAPADALGVKQELEKALAQDGSRRHNAPEQKAW
jgi:hypothetical protein